MKELCTMIYKRYAYNTEEERNRHIEIMEMNHWSTFCDDIKRLVFIDDRNVYKYTADFIRDKE